MKKRLHIILVVAVIGITLLFETYYVSHFDYAFNVADSLYVADSIVNPPPPIPKMYGIPIEDYDLRTEKIRWNQNLSTILKKHDISNQKIDSITILSKGIFDLRKIRAGNKYIVFTTKDSLPVTHYFVYEHSPMEYVVFNIKDSVDVRFETRDIITKHQISSGEITSSLWMSMVESNINPILANDLSEIYAWTIDFFGLQKGDKFTVIYDEEFVDTISIGIGKIHAAIFNHYGNDYWAFPFKQNDVESFFDEEGNSLRRSFLKAPLRFNRISSGFSYSRKHPILKIRRPHLGVDYAAPKGTPVYAIGDGVIIEMKYKKQAGRIMKIKHNSVYRTGYLHLANFAKGLKVGDRVKQGQLIGRVGSTGLSTGPHLDFRFWKNGKPVDPLKIDAPPVEGINESAIDSFNIISKAYMDSLTISIAEKPVIDSLAL
jgi:murein DD-endopeptidase MepM/ murein hydrolase activator NlpD